VAVALNDSPAGLLAWLLEKRHGWSKTSGAVEHAFTTEDHIDAVMIYWITQSFGTSARYYYEALHKPWTPAHDRMPRVEAPVAIPDFPTELVRYPKRWAEKYYNLQRWTPMQAGGHFGAAEQPSAIIEDLRAFFRDKR
jgi:hypothetical protein